MRRTFGFLWLVALGAPVAAGGAEPEKFPTKVVRLVVPQTPGGASDALGRIVAQKLSERWGHQVVVENRPGAGGNIGTESVAKSPPDGYTLLLSYAGTQAINPSLYKHLPYDAINDFQPVATLAVVPFVLAVNPKFPAKNMGEFLALVREKPGEVNYGSAGNGSVNHLLGEMLNSAARIKLVHVPYKGAAPAITDLIGGRIQAVFSSMPSIIQHMREGSVRALAVTSAKRSAAAPDLPTIAESGVAGFDVNPWFGVLAPARTPMPIVRQINADIAAVVKDKDTQTRFEAQGAAPLLTTPEQFLEMLRADVAKWGAVVKASGAQLD